MKKILWFSLGAAVMVGGIWFGRAAWRAHQNLVTLDVKNMPLHDVVRKIERQTWKPVQVDTRLDGKVTLRLKNVPLAEALERLAEEVGGTAQTIHAVHRSTYGLQQLQAALGKGEQLEARGWTNLAPRSVAGEDNDGAALAGGGTSVVAGAPMVITKSGGEPSPEEMEQLIQQQLAAKGLAQLVPQAAISQALKLAMAGSNGPAVHNSPRVRVMSMRVGPDGKVTTSGGDADSPEMARAMSNAVQQALGGTNSGSRQLTMSPPTIRIRKTNPDGSVTSLDTAQLAPERIVIEQALEEKLGGELPQSPTRPAAEQAARKVNGRCTTLYALQKSSLPPMLRFKSFSGGLLPFAKGGAATNGTPLVDQLAQGVRRMKAEQYLNLTPEQRARRMQERQSSATVESETTQP